MGICWIHAQSLYVLQVCLRRILSVVMFQGRQIQVVNKKNNIPTSHMCVLYTNE
jgi:hypothetical protein